MFRKQLSAISAVILSMVVFAGLVVAAPGNSVAYAQAVATATPTIQPVAPPLSSDLTWQDLGAVQKSVYVSNQTLSLSGEMYQAVQQFSTGVPENISNYYSTSSLTALGWRAVGGAGVEGYYWHSSGRYLTVRIGKCVNNSTNFCVNVWESVYAGNNPPSATATPTPTNNAQAAASGSFPDPLQVPAFNQRNYSNTLGSGTGCPTIATDGCWVTSYAMVYNYYHPGYTNPASLNTAIINADLYAWYGSCKDSMPWSPPVAPAGVSFADSKTCTNCAISERTAIDNELAHGRPVLAYDGNIPHMFVITGHKNGDYQINDPWDGSTNRTLSTGALGSYIPTIILIWNGNPPPPPTGFSKTSPANGTVGLNPTNVTLSWNAYSPAPEKYRYCIDTTNNNACDTSAGGYTSEYGTSVTVNLAANTTYYWHVQAVICSTCIPKTIVDSNSGSWWSFNTVGTSATLTPTSTKTATPTPTRTLTPTPTATATPSNIQTQSEYVIGNTLWQAMWRGNQGYWRTVPIISNVIQWTQASAWSGPLPVSTLPGSGDVQTQNDSVVGNTLTQAFWRGNQGWYRTVPIVNNVPQWTDPSAVWYGPLSISTLPGSGDVQTQSESVVGNTLTQAFWRGNQGWYRTVPIVNNVIDWSQASVWYGPLSASTLPGSGDVQTQSESVVGNTLTQAFWRGNQGWYRTVPIVNNILQWSQASVWYGPLNINTLPGG